MKSLAMHILLIDDDRMSDASGDVSKASRSGSSHSESSQECLNEDDNETPYIAAPAEEMGEVRLAMFSLTESNAFLTHLQSSSVTLRKQKKWPKRTNRSSCIC
jgi:hypothetical protein